MRRFALAIMLAARLGAESLPHLEGATLTDKHLALPDAAKGHAALLIVAYTHGSRAQTKAWSERAQRDLADKLAIYSLVVLEDAPRLVRGMAVRGVKGSTPLEQRDHTLIVVHNEKELKLATGFERPDDAYLLLIDAAGEIKWKFHGAPTDAAVQEVQKLAVEERK